MGLTDQEYAIMQAMDRMKKIRIYELHPDIAPAEGQLLTIVALREEGISVSALARELDMPMPAVSRMMRHMEDRGLIERRILPQDRRSILVTVTQKGKEEADDFMERLHGFFQKLLQGMDPQEFDHLMATWNRMMDRMEAALRDQIAELQKKTETLEDTL